MDSLHIDTKLPLRSATIIHVREFEEDGDGFFIVTNVTEDKSLFKTVLERKGFLKWVDPILGPYVLKYDPFKDALFPICTVAEFNDNEEKKKRMKRELKKRKERDQCLLFPKSVGRLDLAK